MGGKRKKIADAPTSKTARASLAKKGKTDAFQASGELDRIVSLDEGNWCYLRSPVSGALYHLRVGSYSYFDRLEGLQGTEHWQRLERELIQFGFPLPKAEEN